MSFRPKVCLVLPHYFSLTVGACRGFYMEPTRCQDVDITAMTDTGSSLLPHTFNALLCVALATRGLGNVAGFPRGGGQGHGHMGGAREAPGASGVAELVSSQRKVRA